MEKRKHIAVIIFDIHEQYQANMLKGILEQSFFLDTDGGGFRMIQNTVNGTAFQRGGGNMFESLNCKRIAGVIYVPGIICNPALKSRLDKILIDCGKPVVCMDHESDIFPSVLASDAEAFERLVDHFIEVHDYKRIFCLTGPEGLIQSEERLNGYINSMKKHGLKIDKKYIRYGDFWENAAVGLAHEIIERRIEKPEAVVCANDWMAINLCNTLTDNGINVPEDVAVSGYDFMQEALDNVPSIASYAAPNHNLGARTVQKLWRLMTGTDCELSTSDLGYVITGQSCGCGKNSKELMVKRKREIKTKQQYEAMYEGSNMAEALTNTSDLDECIDKLDNFTYLISGMENYYLCLCYNWDEMTDYDFRENNYLRTGYTNAMNIKLWKSGTERKDANIQFDKAVMLPALWQERETPAAFYFIPIHFNDRCFGYEALSYGSKLMSYDKLYRSWTKNVNNALEFIRVQNCLKTINQRLFMTSIRDALTGIFNRKGFDQYSEEIIDKARKNNKKMFILAADLDRLKMINDTYGHSEGDNAIAVTANALNTSCINNEICARTGGDEFVVIGCGNYNENIVNGYIEAINGFFRRYNESSNKPYKVEASIGVYCGFIDECTTLKELVDIADKEMYDNKIRKRANRSD